MAILTVKIQVPDSRADDVLNTVTDYLGYDGTTTRQDFLTAKFVQYVKVAYRGAQAEKFRGQIVAAEADADAVGITSYKGVG
jgi:hypothetical protein